MHVNSNSSLKPWTLAIILTGLMVVARVLPHPANMTPMIGACLWLGALYPKRSALGFALVGYLISDWLLALCFGYPWPGHWQAFNLASYTIITLGLGPHLRLGKLKNYGWAGSGALLFWGISNFGVWLVSGMYAMDSAGLVQCYINALPFLTYALIGDIFWMMILNRFVKRWLHLGYELLQCRSLQYENLAGLNQP